ncbi:MAG TPA: response regulator [Candidatus Acidoferrum sp.]|nr:response regulator [Candidatus Acidoferrum sp.]
MSEKPLILMVDDEPQILRLLTVSLEANGYRTLSAASGQEGLVLAAQHQPALVILDIGLPDLSGQEVLRRLREWSRVPVIVLSVRDDERGKVAALDAGADDYVTKPFNTDELLARLRVALRHATNQEEAAVVQAKNLAIDLVTRRVTLGGREVKLSKIEYDLLRLLARHAGKVLTHRQILREVWGPGHEEDTHYLRVYIAHLREKIESRPESPELILTELGVGYRFLAVG